MPSKRYLAAPFYLLIFPPLIVFVGGEVVGDLLASELKFLPPIIAEEPLSVNKIFEEAAGRFGLIGLFFLLSAVSLGIILYFIIWILRNFERKSVIYIISTVLASSAFIAVFFECGNNGCACYAGGLLRGTGALVGKDIFEQGLRLSQQAGGPNDWPSIAKRIIEKFTIPSGVAAACIAVGVIASLARRGSELTIADSVWQKKSADAILYIGAVLLVVGIMFDYTWVRWIGFYLPNNEPYKYRDSYFALGSAWNLFRCINYTLILASVYLPVMAFISAAASKAIALQISQNDTLTEAECRSKNGLNFAIPDVVRGATAILAPFLAGAITTLPSLIK